MVSVVIKNFTHAYLYLRVRISEWVSSSFGSDGNNTVGTKRKRTTKKPNSNSRKATDHQTHKKQQPSPLTTGLGRYVYAINSLNCGFMFMIRRYRGRINFVE